ncbi:MAG: SsrA-binding protein SmpB [Proteobacteria bacterium]|nr:SsrA-binding protein SmpB [Pseudomonadota bacterium]NDC25163.1 SsrA-binding protein SmpB [Pseudomonadota bacterium]NDD05101.1 SsrA-binding protein SmpB [Pseudomonadota bacterium]NDG27727.1 SsrA-binding protein SmpB [Pseudomonadota bacterium]
MSNQEGGIKIICDNRKASHNYFLEERFEAGLVLTGTEVKSLRAGKANLQDAYAILKNGELYLINAHIAPYAQGNRENHDPLRTRKLLVHKSELNKLFGKSEIRGFTLIPTKMYFKKGRAKVEVALAKGKTGIDKRQATKEQEAKREMAKLSKRNRRD